MKKFLRVIAEITSETISDFTYFIKNNLMTFASVLSLILPYITYFIGQNVALNRNSIAVGGEIFIPLLFVIVIYYLKSTANKIGKGTTIPLPEKRFTDVTDDGEVNIEHKRLHELILYVADLEDWMERKGML